MKIGIIGGSGLDDPDILKDAHDRKATTAWGDPSSPLKEGRLGGKDVVLIARHGREHTIPPTQVNYRANIRALKDSGCDRVLATTAVGSLREEIRRGDLVIVDQFIDFTRRRPLSFHESFEPHRPVHAAMAEPYDKDLRAALIASASRLGLRHHPTGTAITIEGPRFSTKAESRIFRAWGADVINMSTATETALAVEAGLAYAAVAMSTDYDSWKDDEEAVSWEAVLEVFNKNAGNVTRLLVDAVAGL